MLVPVILSGGAGSRLWPVSRESSPKPFMHVGTDGSLLRKTFERAGALPRVAEIVTVTNREYLFRTREEYGCRDGHVSFILEPFARNTAPALALAALHVSAHHGNEAVMLMLAADHVIRDQDAFAADVAIAQQLAASGMLVTFGIRPTRPETGFGYIELGELIGGGSAFRAARFVEKPCLELAQKYFNAGTFLWNSGMFCFTAGTLLRAIEAHEPELMAGARACWDRSVQAAKPDSGVLEIDAGTFAELAAISIDYAVMERAPNVAVVRASFDWSDIGSWEAIHHAAASDSSGNSVVGDAILVDVSNAYINSDGRIVAAIGMDNVIIVDTPDALLVADRGRSQDVKKVVDQLKQRKHESVKEHRTVSRPWGRYTVLEEGKGFKIKRIVVKPGQALSLQLHHHRSEHWVVVSGTAQVTNGDRVMLLNASESTFVPALNKHRLSNSSSDDLVIIEVQTGDYLGEDDIVRFQDNYDRV